MDLSNLQKYAYVAQIIQVFLSVLTSAATIAILALTFRLNVRNQSIAIQSKRADVLSEYNARYSRTWEMRANDDVINNPSVFYERFWSLQFDQFFSWRNGLIQHEIFSYWAQSRYDDWISDKKFGSMSYREGFQSTVNDWKHSEFLDFMTLLHKQGADKALEAFPPKVRQ